MFLMNTAKSFCMGWNVSNLEFDPNFHNWMFQFRAEYIQRVAVYVLNLSVAIFGVTIEIIV